MKSQAERRSLLLLFLLPASGALAAADEFYVDAVNGDNANAGSSQLEAWQTLTYARAHIAGAGHTLHVAPGLYDAALGEHFPVGGIQGLRIVGDQGSDVTILDAGGAYAVLRSTDVGSAEVAGLTLLDAGTGIENYVATDGSFDLVVRDVRIEDMTYGVYGDAFGLNTASDYSMQLDGVRVRQCVIGVHVSNQGHHSGTSVTIVDSDLTECGVGLSARCGGPGSGHGLGVRRCRIESNEVGANLVGDDWVPWYASFEDCVIARNASHGISARAESGGSLRIVRSTVADNGGPGVLTIPPTRAVLQGSIVYGNNDDVVGLLEASYSDIGDGDLAGTAGNFSADPLFLDAAAGDWRLRFDSPCIDAGVPTVPPGVLDVAGVPRPLDGDLDAAGRADVGAHELAPLGVSGAARVGQSLAFELWGPAGGISTLLGSRGAPLADPVALPTGELFLARERTIRLGVARVAPGPPGTFDLALPADPGLVGTTLSFQALTDTQSPVLPRVLTNVVVVVVEP